MKLRFNHLSNSSASKNSKRIIPSIFNNNLTSRTEVSKRTIFCQIWISYYYYMFLYSDQHDIYLVDILTMFWPLYPPTLLRWLLSYKMDIIMITPSKKNGDRLLKFTFEFLCTWRYVQFFSTTRSPASVCVSDCRVSTVSKMRLFLCIVSTICEYINLQLRKIEKKNYLGALAHYF